MKRFLGPAIHGRRRPRAAPELLDAAPMETMSEEAVAVPPSRTSRARLVPPLVLTGHVSSLLPYKPDTCLCAELVEGVGCALARVVPQLHAARAPKHGAPVPQRAGRVGARRARAVAFSPRLGGGCA